MAQPHVPQKYIIALLMQVQLPPVTETHVHFAVLVDVGRIGEGSGPAIQHEDAAATDADEETNVVLAPSSSVLVIQLRAKRDGGMTYFLTCWLAPPMVIFFLVLGMMTSLEQQIP